MKLKTFLLLATIYSLLFTSIGCEAFVRKFTRKSKKEIQKEEPVLAPEEYKGPQMSREELYRQYLLFWRSWHDELINSLSSGANHKKQVGCVNETIKNLGQLRTLINEEKQKKLDNYISQLKDLKDLIVKDPYGNNLAKNRFNAERIKRDILRDFSYNKISKDVTYGTK